MGLALGEEVVTPDERAVVADFIAFLKEGLSSTVSARALIRSANCRGSLTQAGIRPHRMRRKCRASFSRMTTGTGWVGAILYRGGKF